MLQVMLVNGGGYAFFALHAIVCFEYVSDTETDLYDVNDTAWRIKGKADDLKSAYRGNLKNAS